MPNRSKSGKTLAELLAGSKRLNANARKIAQRMAELSSAIQEAKSAQRDRAPRERKR